MPMMSGTEGNTLLLPAAKEDTEHQGSEGQEGHAEPEVGRVVLPLSLSQPVGQRRLQAHKQHTGGEGDARSDIVENFGIIHLPGEENKRWCYKIKQIEENICFKIPGQIIQT